jgi:O-antigen/teichoic acid export membrane protein
VLGKAREVGSALVYEIVYALSLMVVFPLTIRGLGTEGYGQYASMYVIAGFAITWVFAGGGAAAVQLILQRERNPASVVRAAHRQVVATALPAGLIGAVLTYVLLGSDLVGPAVLVFGSDLLIAGLAEVYISAIYARLGVPASVRIRSCGPILRAAGVAGLALTDSISITSLVVVNLASTIAILGLAYLAARRVMAEQVSPTSSATSAREVFGLSMMYSTSISTNSVQIEGEKIILAASRPSSEVGEYMAAYRVVSVAVIPLKAVNVAANQWFLPRDDREGSQVRRSSILSAATVVYGVVCAIAIVLGQPIIAWVVGDEFEAAVQIAVWLAAVPLFQGLAEIPPLGLLGLGENRNRMLLGLVTAALATVGYLVLIPWLGWQGAVIGTYLSETLSILGGWWLLLRCQRRSDQRGTSA